MISRPLARIWIAASGVVLGAAVGGHIPWLAGAVAVCIGGVALLIRRCPAVLLAGIALLGAGCGLLASSIRSDAPRPLESAAARVPRCDVRGRVTEQLGGLGTLGAVVRADCEGEPSFHFPGNVVFDAARADVGAEFIASGWLIPLKDNRFDTQRARLGAHAVLVVDDLQFGPVHGRLASIAARVRAGLRKASGSLDPRTGGLLRGLAIGDVSGIDPATEESLRRAGLSHLVAVSGSNVAIVLGAVALLCKRVGLRLRIGLAGLVLLLFVAVVGQEPSVMRAAFMGAVGLVAIAAGSRAHPLYALGLALIVLLGLRPEMVFSVGLHLSAAATLGIILWTSAITRRFRRLPAWLATPLAATMAAQIAVAPLLVLVFGEVSVVAPVANLLVFPAVPLATVVGLLAGVVGAVAPALGGPLAELSTPAIGWILGVGDRFGEPRWASVALPEWTVAALLAPALVFVARALRRGLRVAPE